MSSSTSSACAGRGCMRQKECADPDDRHRPSHEVSARFKLCLDTLQAASVPKIAGEPVVDSRIPVNLPVDTLRCTVAGFGSAGGPAAPRRAQCDLRGSTPVLTWQGLDSSSPCSRGLYSYGPCSNGLYSHDPCVHGLYSHGLCSYGLCSYGPCSYSLYSYGICSYGPSSCGLYSYGLGVAHRRQCRRDRACRAAPTPSKFVQ